MVGCLCYTAIYLLRKMANYLYLVLVLLAVVVSSTLPQVQGQTIVDNSVCERHHLSCPGRSASYKKYCCVEYNNHNETMYCCSPYFEFYASIVILLPLITCSFVILITVYCCWWKKRRRRRQQLMNLYLTSRITSTLDEVVSNAPPPYTPTDENNKDCQLPQYSEEDPYSNAAPVITRDNEDVTLENTCDNRPLLQEEDQN